ncbi:prepilin-type N-terminal cleavage/methylation domain-containing protein [Candidatus Dojkabacteria bacterium]|nr:prepilin-type N-terminal cleavage/methylation domain-containing protein [Candidatus Dojkabacteria bacterium]
MNKRLSIKLKSAFTLLELLLVIAIIAVLAGLVIFNIRPADVLQNANDTKNVANSKDIKKAIESYVLDHEGNMPSSLQGQLSGEYTICKQEEVSCPVGSISLDELIAGGYLSTIPVNENLAGEKTTGYVIEYDATKGTVEIVTGEAVATVLDFGTGADGAITIAANKNINTDTIATGRTCADGINYSVSALTTNSATLSTTPAAGCLAANDTVLLINLQGISTNYSNVGNYELLTVQTATGTNVTFTGNKTKYYGNGASDDTNLGTATTNQRVMLQRVPNYTDVTVNNGVTLTASAWDGTKGGVLIFKASGTTAVNGNINMNQNGYRGIVSSNVQGESINGLGLASSSPNNGGGGAGLTESFKGLSGPGGGGFGSAGIAGTNCPSGCSTTFGQAGNQYGNAQATKLLLGSAGGNGTTWCSGVSGKGGNGGGILKLIGSSITINSANALTSNGENGGSPTACTCSNDDLPGGAGGSGGQIYFRVNTISGPSGFSTATGGNAGPTITSCSGYNPGNAGAGGNGRITIYYSTSLSGTTTPVAYTENTEGTPTPTPTPSIVYGSGADGAVTIASNKNINTDTIATGRTCADGINYSVTTLTANSATLSTTPAAGCLATNDTVLLINLQGISTNYANVGNYELLTVQSATGSNVTFTANKTKYYGNGASDDTNIGTATTNQRVMLQRVPNYTDVTVNNSVTLTASAWDGTKGGVLIYKANGTSTITGSIDMVGKGYRGGGPGPGGCTNQVSGYQGESTTGIGAITGLSLAQGGGGGGYQGVCGWGLGASPGGGGGYGTAGICGLDSCQGTGGSQYGTANLSSIYLGSGGGAGGTHDAGSGGNGGNGGGGISLITNNLVISGTVNSKGTNGLAGTSWSCGGGGGSGGSILIQGNQLTIGSNLISSIVSTGGSCPNNGGRSGGTSGAGRIAISGTVTGTTNPSYTAL